MAMTTAGMTPSVNGDSFKARTVSPWDPINSEDASWGFKTDGVSAYTGTKDKRSNPERPLNPYIEMRRRRSDLHMVRYQLRNIGTLPQRQQQRDEKAQFKRDRFEQRLRTPDRNYCLSISQMEVNSPLSPSIDLPELHANFSPGTRRCQIALSAPCALAMMP